MREVTWGAVMAMGSAESWVSCPTYQGSGPAWKVRGLVKPGKAVEPMAIRRRTQHIQFASFSLLPGTVAYHDIYSHDVSREDLIVSNPSVKRLNEAGCLPKDTQARPLTVFPSPSSFKKPLMT